jgi:hypothetical protein
MAIKKCWFPLAGLLALALFSSASASAKNADPILDISIDGYPGEVSFAKELSYDRLISYSYGEGIIRIWKKSDRTLAKVVKLEGGIVRPIDIIPDVNGNTALVIHLLGAAVLDLNSGQIKWSLCPVAIVPCGEALRWAGNRDGAWVLEYQRSSGPASASNKYAVSVEPNGKSRELPEIPSDLSGISTRKDIGKMESHVRKQMELIEEAYIAKGQRLNRAYSAKYFNKDLLLATAFEKFITIQNFKDGSRSTHRIPAECSINSKSKIAFAEIRPLAIYICGNAQIVVDDLSRQAPVTKINLRDEITTLRLAKNDRFVYLDTPRTVHRLDLDTTKVELNSADIGESTQSDNSAYYLEPIDTQWTSVGFKPGAVAFYYLNKETRKAKFFSCGVDRAVATSYVNGLYAIATYSGNVCIWKFQDSASIDAAEISRKAFDIFASDKNKPFISFNTGSTVTSLQVLVDQNKIIATSLYGGSSIYSIEPFQTIVTSYAIENGEWIAFSGDGYFDRSYSAESLLYKYGDVKLSASQVYDVFFRPDILRSRVAGVVKAGFGTSSMLDMALKSPPPSVRSLLGPKADITTERIRISYTIQSEGGGVGEVQVLHNGKLVKSDGFYKDAPGSTMVALNTTKATSTDEVAKGMRKMLGAGETTASAANTGGNRDSVVVRQAKPKTLNAAGEFSDSVEIDVIPGEDNEITVMARNQDNTILGQGQTVRFKSNLPKADPHLWILPVGIASFQDSGVRQLASPKKDALDFACSYGGKEALKSAGINCDKPGYASSLFKSANIHVVDPLTNEKATRANILAKLDEIAAKAKPTDTFIWFVSSHGTMDANSVYGIVPFDAKCQDPECKAASGLVSSNDILEKSKSIKAMKQLLILDTCNAGGLDNKMSGLYDARMSGLAKNMGLHLYAAATATEFALDGQDASKNSIFTATLLDGLAGASAKNTEGQISIIPLGQYVKINTAETSRKVYPKDTPQTPVIQHFGKDAPLAGVASR